jgi:hypothetical protein
MIVLFHENVLLLSTNNFIVIPIKYRNFGAFVYDSAEKQMLNAISLVIEQWKNEFVRIAKVRFFPIYFYALWGWYHFPDTCQDLFLAERVISQVLKTS